MWNLKKNDRNEFIYKTDIYSQMQKTNLVTKVKSENEVDQSCLTLSDRMDCSLPGSSVPGIFQARVLEWGAIAFSD